MSPVSRRSLRMTSSSSTKGWLGQNRGEGRRQAKREFFDIVAEDVDTSGLGERSLRGLVRARGKMDVILVPDHVGLWWGRGDEGAGHSGYLEENAALNRGYYERGEPEIMSMDEGA